MESALQQWNENFRRNYSPEDGWPSREMARQHFLHARELLAKLYDALPDMAVYQEVAELKYSKLVQTDGVPSEQSSHSENGPRNFGAEMDHQLNQDSRDVEGQILPETEGAWTAVIPLQHRAMPAKVARMTNRNPKEHVHGEYPRARLMASWGGMPLMDSECEWPPISAQLRAELLEWNEHFLRHFSLDDGWQSKEFADVHFSRARELLAKIYDELPDCAVYQEVFELRLKG